MLVEKIGVGWFCGVMLNVGWYFDVFGVGFMVGGKSFLRGGWIC